ncbi:type 2 isopentenyl-diphosphate Delta-isomerase [Brevibacillus sp. SYSU BS000544]|uniref:type 2 isopentenyl-diphosphate Delta-isomerase n=1 Tax=Brevibacillus sp. SYSU BS000544 TaxID=3416443 RepID=UPI003CE58D65
MSRSSRKLQHIQYAMETRIASDSSLEAMKFVPNSLPNISYVNSMINTEIHKFKLNSPIIINAMTGGAEATSEINRKLAIISREKQLAMAVGSQMAAIRDKTVRSTFSVVRDENPEGILFANLGAEATTDQAKEAVEMIEANALQIHLNVMQELLMPEGDRYFSGYLSNIEKIISSISVPVIVKEVGFGMSRQTINQLASIGVAVIDVGGAGGTNFARVENRRSENPLEMFNDWGFSTLQSLLEAKTADTAKTSIIATGGIRHGLDIAKVIALGADAAGMAGYFLQLVQTKSVEECLDAVDQLHHQIRVAMVALGAVSLQDLREASYTFSSDIYNWAVQRGLNL